MAERIESLSERRGRPPLYPWADWADGCAWRIVHGEDFEVAPESMRRALRDHAARSGLTVVVTRDGSALEFQFAAPKPSESRAAA